MNKILYLAILFALLFTSCEQKKPEFAEFRIEQDSLVYIFPEDGQFQFSGFSWQVVEQTEPQSMLEALSLSHKDNVYLDNRGRLYLKLSKIGDTWYGAEVVCNDNFGKGDYIFYLETNSDEIAQNSVFSISTKLFSNRRHNGLTEAGIRIYGKKFADENNLLEYFTYSTNQKFASVEEPVLRAKQTDEPTLHIISLQSRALSFATREGYSYDHSRFLAEYSVYKKQISENNSNVDDIVYAQIGVPMRPTISYFIEDTIQDTTITEAVVVISKFEFLKPINQVAKK